MKFCGKCGTQMNEGAKFCRSCGTATVKQPLYQSTQFTPVSRRVNHLKKRSNKKVIGIITCATVALILIIGSISVFNGSRNQNGIVGSWINSNGEVCLVFNKDGSFQATNKQIAIPTDSINYKTTQNQTVIFSDIYGHPYEPAQYRIKENTLYIQATRYGIDSAFGEFEFYREGSKKSNSNNNQNFGNDNSVYIDPFDGLVVEFDGISPFCTVSINNAKCSQDAQLNVEYSLSPNEITIDKKFAIDEEVKIYASLKNPNSTGTTLNETSYTLIETERTFIIKDVPKYITEITPDMDFTQFKREVEDYLTSITAWAQGDYCVFSTPRGLFVESLDLAKNDSYFQAIKLNLYDGFDKNKDYFNRIDITYSIVIANTDSNTHRHGDLYIAELYFNRYFTIYATNIVQYPDGKIGWGGNDPASLSFDHYVNVNSMDDLVNENFTSKKADYNVATVTDIFK